MMSLISILSNMAGGSSTAGMSAITATQARLALAQAAVETKANSTANTVQISDAATLAEATLSDQAKDFGALAREMRATLDSQYKVGEASLKLGKISGRGLAAVVLNEGSPFSREEQSAARAELKAREREVMTTALSGGVSVATLASYGKTLAKNFDAKSTEERRVLGYTEQTRLNAARMASTTTVSLFDEID